MAGRVTLSIPYWQRASAPASSKNKICKGIGDAMSAEGSAAPRQTLSLFDGVVMVVGMVVGIGIFATPSLVAQFAGNSFNYLALWLAGGLLALNGALCYAELATRFPSAGGEYQFLARAYGRNLALLFAWARCSVIQTGSIALVAFVYGDYAQSLLPLGSFGAAIHAAIIIAVFTAINMAGTFQGTLAQKIFTSMDLIALLLLLAAGAVLILGGSAAPAPVAVPSSGGGGMIGLAVVFVMLTYGGWNESAYLSAELKDGKRNMVRVLVLSILLVAALYFAVAFIYLKAMGYDWLAKFGRWDAAGENPANAFLLQGAVALALVLLAVFVGENGFRTMVDYTAPVFWLFMTMVGVSLFLFRHRNQGEAGGYRVPLYPVTPLIFVATCLYMLWSSVDYVREGSLAGLAVLLAGVPLLFFRGGAKADPAE
jgi:APA family basic amino acid/polyamine antiporter